MENLRSRKKISFRFLQNIFAYLSIHQTKQIIIFFSESLKWMKSKLDDQKWLGNIKSAKLIEVIQALEGNISSDKLGQVNSIIEILKFSLKFILPTNFSDISESQYILLAIIDFLLNKDGHLEKFNSKVKGLTSSNTKRHVS